MDTSASVNPAQTGRDATYHPATDPRQLLTFQSGGECYALGIMTIKEILEYGGVTPVPLMPAFIRGVINLRGAVVPVIDLAARLGFAATEAAERACVIIVELHTEDGQFDLGLVVDSVSEVVELAPAMLQSAPQFGARIRAEFIESMATIDGRLVIVLRLERVLSIDEMAVLDNLSDAERVPA